MVRDLAGVIGKNNAVVVAHPDDESLWCGGLLARFSDRRWTIIAATIPVADPLREGAFYRACEVFGASGIILGIADLGVKSSLGNGAGYLSNMVRGFDCVVTHGKNGEYGHPHHTSIRRYVEDGGVPVVGIGWHPGGAGEIRLDLTDEEKAVKDRALRCYGHIYDSLVTAYFIRDKVPRDHETYDVG